MNRRHVTALVFVLCCSTSSLAENWPNWRGPNFDGVAAPGDYPVQWTTTENVIWKVALPSSAGSTPIVWGDHIFVDGARDGKNLVQCFDWDGNIQWEREQGTERQGKHRKGSGANPSPVTDGQHVYCYFKSGDLSCYDFTGKLIWQKNLQAEFGPDSLWWDLGTSPVLTDNCVIVACMQDAPSYVVALDKRTGKQVWKVDRNLNAPEESHQAYTTPIVTKRGDTTVLLVLGSDHLTAHDAQTGTELWRSAGFNPTGETRYRSIASAVVSGDTVVAPYARGKLLRALRLGGHGDVTDSHLAWEIKSDTPDVPTPAAVGDAIIVCTDKGKVMELDVATGKVRVERDLPAGRDAFSASPAVTQSHVYVTRENGTTYVLDRQQELKVIAENRMDESVIATPVLIQNRVLLRTAEHLYCLGS